jgi:hypothetical protein
VIVAFRAAALGCGCHRLSMQAREYRLTVDGELSEPALEGETELGLAARSRRQLEQAGARHGPGRVGARLMVVSFFAGLREHIPPARPGGIMRTIGWRG